MALKIYPFILLLLRLDKKGDDHVTGSMMDMFDAEGDRVKDMKQ
jgi:hypothetical protein